jgi:hypothetical protein
MIDLWSIASDYGHCRRGFRALARDKTEVSAGHSSGGRLKIENVARDIRGPKIEKSPASVAVKAAPITWTPEFAWVISALGGIPLNIKFQAEISAVVSDVPVMPSAVMAPVTVTVPEKFTTRRFTS